MAAPGRAVRARGSRRHRVSPGRDSSLRGSGRPARACRCGCRGRPVLRYGPTHPVSLVVHCRSTADRTADVGGFVLLPDLAVGVLDDVGRVVEKFADGWLVEVLQRPPRVSPTGRRHSCSPEAAPLARRWEPHRWTAGGQTPLDRASRGGTGQPAACALIRENDTGQHDEAPSGMIAHGLVMRRSRVRIPKAALRKPQDSLAVTWGFCFYRIRRRR